MNRRTRQFRELFARLPESVRVAAEEAFRQFVRDPSHPSLRHHELKNTKKGQHRDGSRAVHFTRKYCAIYVRDGTTNVWYWIGSHEDYNNFTGLK